MKMVTKWIELVISPNGSWVSGAITLLLWLMYLALIRYQKYLIIRTFYNVNEDQNK